MLISVEILITIIGSLFGAVMSYIYYIEKRHRKKEKETDERHERERKAWAERDQKNLERINEMADDTNAVLRENTNILSGLKTLLENQRRNGR